MPYAMDALQYLQELQEDGGIRHLGLTNFDTKHMNYIYDNGIKIVSNQVLFNPSHMWTSSCLPTWLATLISTCPPAYLSVCGDTPSPAIRRCNTLCWTSALVF